MSAAKKGSSGVKKIFEVLALVFVVSVVGASAVQLISFEEKLKGEPMVLLPGETLNSTLEKAEGDCELTLSGDLALFVSGTETILGVDGMKTVTIDGEDVGSITAFGGKESVISPISGGKLVFKNLTINDGTEKRGAAYRDYLWLSGDLVFENCTFTDSIYLKPDSSVYFYDCTFQSVTERYYGVWVGDGTVSFEGCCFQGFRGLKIHEFNESENVEFVRVEECLFDNLSEKPGIAIGNVDANTTVSVKDNIFDGCIGWDSVGSLVGEDGMFECDTPLSDFTFESNNNRIKNVRYTITYKAIINGIVAVPERMYKSKGNYPTFFKSGETVVISDLADIFYDAYTSYEFVGWYLDKACTQAFKGVIEGKSNVTLYAKISVEKWTANY